MLVFLIFFSLIVKSQELKKQLQNKIWFGNEIFYFNKPFSLTSDSISYADWKAKLPSTGKLYVIRTLVESTIDSDGAEKPVGFRFIDSASTYQFHLNRIKIDNSTPAREGQKAISRIFYYRVEELPNKNGYQFNPIREEDF